MWTQLFEFAEHFVRRIGVWVAFEAHGHDGQEEVLHDTHGLAG